MRVPSKSLLQKRTRRSGHGVPEVVATGEDGPSARVVGGERKGALLALVTASSRQGGRVGTQVPGHPAQCPRGQARAPEPPRGRGSRQPQPPAPSPDVHAGPPAPAVCSSGTRPSPRARSGLSSARPPRATPEQASGRNRPPLSPNHPPPALVFEVPVSWLTRHDAQQGDRTREATRRVSPRV